MKYIELFNTALTNYSQQKPRTHHTLAQNNNNASPRLIYHPGFFTSLRHSKKKYPKLAQLESLLQNARNEDEARSFIIKHFNDAKATWHNHSFNCYLLDALLEHKADEWEKHWQIFDRKPIAYYQGILFRGTSTPPDIVFAQGFRKDSDTDIESHIAAMTFSTGISTSKRFDGGLKYALLSRSPGMREYSCIDKSRGYVYIIDYKGQRGFDLEATFAWRKTGKNLPHVSGGDDEVNIAESIAVESIVGAFYIENKQYSWHSNPRYTHVQKAEERIKALLPQNVAEMFKIVDLTEQQTHRPEV